MNHQKNDKTLNDLVAKIKLNPELRPSFRAEVPLGLSDEMLQLVHFGVQSLPVLKTFLQSSDLNLRKAAVAMLAYIDSGQAEELMTSALSDIHIRAEAIICLGNMFMRNPDSDYAGEQKFLRQPKIALSSILEFLEDDSEVIVESGFTVYKGPVEDLAIGVAVRIIGLHMFKDILDPEDHEAIGWVPYTLSNTLKSKLRNTIIQITKNN